jgi:carboxypeptidase Q
MRSIRSASLFVALTLTPGLASNAQKITTSDSILRRIWTEAYERSQLRTLAQPLIDSIGSRLTGSPSDLAAHRWVNEIYKKWGIRSFDEQYAPNVPSWQRGHTRAELIAPNYQTLHAIAETKSPATNGPIEGSVIAIPDVRTRAEFDAWLPSAKGKFVLVSFPRPHCRPDAHWRQFSDSAEYAAMDSARSAAWKRWVGSIQTIGLGLDSLVVAIERAGAIGFFEYRWIPMIAINSTPENRYVPSLLVYDAVTSRSPMVGLSCEDYTLLSRLAGNKQGPRVRVDVGGKIVGTAPVLNTLAEIRGKEKPDEYVVLSAHLDSYDAGRGATDNGSGTLIMMEAMRILKTVYPNPKRTIMARHWSGEEQGIGDRRPYRADMQPVLEKTQLLMNQDNGTGRIKAIWMEGRASFADQWNRWLGQLPPEVTGGIKSTLPPADGSDYLACAGFPLIELSTDVRWEYFWPYHSELDTYDKLVWPDLQHNAALVAMLAYVAAEDPQLSDRGAIEVTDSKTGQKAPLKQCRLGGLFTK